MKLKVLLVFLLELVLVLCWAELVERAEVLLMVLVVLAGEKKDTTMLRENTPTNC